jgi:phosphohistidine phosphatase SixA
MTMIRLMMPAFLLAAASCATAAPDTSESAYYVMRHLEKSGGSDPALNEEGKANALRLAERFAGERIAAVYVSTTRRARETAAPLAVKFGLAPKEYDPGDTAALVERVKAETGTVLIVGHSNTVPEIVERLGGTRPADLAETEFGSVWRVSRIDGRTQVSNLSD